MKRKKAFWSWLLVILVMLVIFYFSDQESVESSNTSSGITKVVYEILNLDVLFEFESFHSLVRKVAHFCVFGLLGMLIYNAIFHSIKMKFINILIFSLILVFIYASFDEIHQLFVLGRSGEVRDVLIDSSGGSVGSLLYYFYLKIKY